MKWLIRKGLLPATCAVEPALRKPGDTTTYCYTPDEVVSMIAFCDKNKRLHWLGAVIHFLSHTGMRIGELVDARRCDLSDD